MKDEIKEILDYISSRTVDDILLPDYFEKIEDYITNLQEENEKLNNRNEFLEKVCVGFDDKYEYIKSLNKKAIEYLNKHTNNEVEYLDIIEVKELKNILEGCDKE